MGSAVSSAVPALPAGFVLDTPPEPPPGFTMDKPAGKPSLAARAADVVTGNLRTTPEIEALPDWTTMPEMNSASWASFKSGLGTLLANPEETVKILQSNFPAQKGLSDLITGAAGRGGVTARQDEKGNYILRSSLDGKEYAIKPGFRASDIPRAIGALLAFTPAGRAETILGAGAKSAATQAAIEGTQAATGGDFNLGEVAQAGALGAAVPAISTAVGAGVSRLRQARGTGAPAATVARRAPQTEPETPGIGNGSANLEPGVQGGSAPTATPAAPAVPPGGTASPGVSAGPAQLSPEELGQATRRAAMGGLGSKSAREVLAQEAAPSADVVEAARRLGVEDYLQPDHVTTNQAFRELSQVLKSVPGSASGTAEREGLAQVARRADDLITEIGGTHDISTLNVGVKQRLNEIHKGLKDEADKLYDEVRAAIPAKSPAPADNVLALINQRAEDLGGRQYLSAMEKKVLARLSPRASAATETVPGNPLMPGSMTDTTRQVTTTRQPTYALLDDVRRDLTAAKYQRTGAFKDSDDRLLDMVESALRKDQEAAASQYGMQDTWNLAQKTARAYKSVQQDLTALFGRQLDGTIVRDLSAGVANMAKGDTTRFAKLISAVPEDMRQEVVASGLATAFGKSARNGSINFNSYARWYEGLQRNGQAMNALMSNLPKEARQQLRDLYVVSNAISKATRERITTGRLTEGMRAIESQLEAPNNLMARAYEAASKAAGAAAAEAVTTSVGLPGAGLAAGLASALRSGPKTGAFEAADKLFASPDFIRLARAATPEARASALEAMSRGRPFGRLMATLGVPRDQSVRERWLQQAVLAANTQSSAGQQ